MDKIKLVIGHGDEQQIIEVNNVRIHVDENVFLVENARFGDGLQITKMRSKDFNDVLLIKPRVSNQIQIK